MADPMCDCLATTDDTEVEGSWEPGHWCCLPDGHPGEHQCGACPATWETEDD